MITKIEIKPSTRSFPKLMESHGVIVLMFNDKGEGFVVEDTNDDMNIKHQYRKELNVQLFKDCSPDLVIKFSNK